MAEEPIWAEKKLLVMAHDTRVKGGNTLLEGLLDLLQVRKVTNVTSDALGGGAEGGEGVGDAQVDLAGVGLGGNGVDAAEASFLS